MFVRLTLIYACVNDPGFETHSYVANLVILRLWIWLLFGMLPIKDFHLTKICLFKR